MADQSRRLKQRHRQITLPLVRRLEKERPVLNTQRVVGKQTVLRKELINRVKVKKKRLDHSPEQGRTSHLDWEGLFTQTKV